MTFSFLQKLDIYPLLFSNRSSQEFDVLNSTFSWVRLSETETPLSQIYVLWLFDYYHFFYHQFAVFLYFVKCFVWFFTIFQNSVWMFLCPPFCLYRRHLPLQGVWHLVPEWKKPPSPPYVLLQWAAKGPWHGGREKRQYQPSNAPQLHIPTRQYELGRLKCPWNALIYT